MIIHPRKTSKIQRLVVKRILFFNNCVFSNPEQKSSSLKTPEEENLSLKAISRSLTLLEAHQNGVDHKVGKPKHK